MRGTTIVFSAILFLAVLATVEAYDANLGNFNFQSLSVKWQSIAWMSDITIVTDDSITLPFINVVARNLPSSSSHQIPSDLTEVVSTDSSGKSTLNGLATTSGSPAPAMGPLSTLLVAMLALPLALVFRSKPSTASIVVLAVAGTMLLQGSFAATGPWYDITLHVPTAGLDGLTLWASGTVQSAGFVANSVSIDSCATPGSQIALTTPIVAISLELCSDAYTAVDGLQFGGQQVDVSLEALSGDVAISFAAAFAGTFTAEAPASNDITLVNSAHCILGNKRAASQHGSCGAAQVTLDLQGGNAVWAGFGIRDALPATTTAATTTAATTTSTTTKPSSGTCPASSDNSPSSLSVSSSWVIPGETTTRNTISQWWLSNTWSTSAEQAATFGFLNPTSSQMSIRTKGWGSAHIYMISKPDSLPTLYQNSQYTVSFSLSQDSNNWWNGPNGRLDYGAAGTDHQVYVVVASRLPESSQWAWTNGQADAGACASPSYCEIIATQKVGTDKLTALKSFSLSFTPTADWFGAQMYVHIIQPAQSGNDANRPAPLGNLYFVNDVQLARADKSRSFDSPLITKPNEFVDIPVQPTITLPARSDCPHAQSGLKDWFDAATWSNGKVPAADKSAITLPANTKVLLSSCSSKFSQPTGTYGTIVVPSTSELIFDDSPLSLTFSNIQVDGALRMGSETCRLYSKIELTFDSSAPAINSLYGKIALAVSDQGTLDIHGKLYQPTWARLASRAFIADDRVILQQSVNWEVGQQVVIATTAWNDTEAVNQNEVRTIKAVDGNKIQFTEPLDYFHFAVAEYCAEVGLLSRRIHIAGDDQSPSGSYPKGTGFHLMSRGTARISGLEVERGGQTNVLARYSIHFHMMADASGSYVTDCAIHRSFYRCIAIHGTDNALIERNVCYDHVGHGYYIEDGVEEGNSLRFNLAVHPHPLFPSGKTWLNFGENGSQNGIVVPSDSGVDIPADIAAGGFYITNANNKFYGNAASGGWTGYTFVNLPAPIGLHVDDDVVPMNRPLAQFKGNTAHSAGVQWSSAGCLYTGGMLWIKNGVLTYDTGRHSRDSTNDDGSPHWMVFEDTVFFQCQQGLNHWGNRADVINYAVYDMSRAATVFGESSVTHAKLVQSSSNPQHFVPKSQWDGRAVFQFYDISVKTILYDIEIKNVLDMTPMSNNSQRLNNYAFISLDHSSYFAPQGINSASKIKYTNVWHEGSIGHVTRMTKASRQYNVVHDGSWALNPFGANVATISGGADDEPYDPAVPSSMRIKGWWNVGPCTTPPEWTMVSCRKTDDHEIANIAFKVAGLTMDTADIRTSTAANTVGTVSKFGFTAANRKATTIMINAGTTGITGLTGPEGWYFNLKNGSPNSFQIAPLQVPLTDKGNTYVLCAFRYPASATFTISTSHDWKTDLNNPALTAGANKAALMGDAKGWTYFFDKSANDGHGVLYIKLVDLHYNSEPANSNAYIRNGAKLYDVSWGPYRYTIAAACSGCDSKSSGGVTYFTVTDVVPPNF